MLSAHAVAQYEVRVRPGLDLDTARTELERLRLVGEICAVPPAWVSVVNPAPYYLLVGDAVVLPLVQRGDSWIATTCIIQGTLTPTRRSFVSGRKASLRARKRARRRKRL
jgi:hypothetical protein